MTEVRKLFDELRQRPFPKLGSRVGHLLLYDSYLAGNASTHLNGRPLVPREITQPDLGTLTYVEGLKRKSTLSEDERELLAYFELLERLRVALVEATRVSGD